LSGISLGKVKAPDLTPFFSYSLTFFHTFVPFSTKFIQLHHTHSFFFILSLTLQRYHTYTLFTLNQSPTHLASMRFTSAVAVAASVVPLAVSATGKFGYALGVRHSGQPYCILDSI